MTGKLGSDRLTNPNTNYYECFYYRSMVQAWYECEDCEYACHHKCLASIVRDCAHVVASERGSFEYEICPELGLSSQQYLCAECKSPLPISKCCC